LVIVLDSHVSNID